MNLDAESFRESYLSGQRCEGALDQSGACPTLSEALASEIDAWLDDHGETTSFEELAAGRESTLEEEKFLPLSMVGRLISIEGFGIELPEDLRFRVHLRVRAHLQNSVPFQSARPDVHQIWIALPSKYRSLADQVIRAASSVPANLAEGRGRSGKDRQYHFRVALGSAREVDVHLRLLQSIGTVDRQKATTAVELFDRVRAMTWRLLHPRR